jgi:3',5'-nucleoside bisphosphate phosphatase
MIDLHTHSTCSDGTDTPAQLVAKAERAGMKVLALTDHDTVSGFAEAKGSLTSGMSLVLGSEISCQTEDGISVHMLGYLFDPTHGPLAQILATTRENRYARMERIIARLNDAGIDITLEEVLDELSEGATLGRPHLADALVRKNIVKDREEAFAELLHNRSPYYVAHYSPTPEVAIRMIKDAGGVAVIAHPLASLRGRVISEDSFSSYAAAGLDGIEVSHRDHAPEQREMLEKIANSLSLLRTGSSDYHGNGKLNQLGEFTTDPEQWLALAERATGYEVVYR